jgi:hypothetical protein
MSYKVSTSDWTKYLAAVGQEVANKATDADVIAWLKARPEGGMKFDGGKHRWTLVLKGMDKALRGVVAVATFGAVKYAADSWQNVEGAQVRYEDGLHRHLDAIHQYGWGSVDEDSGLLHAFHLAWNALALAWFAARDAETAAREATR